MRGQIPLRRGHFLKGDLRAFDAPFFSISPAEASCMDPQHRKILETGYHALEDAGIPIAKCAGSDTSVYTGCFTNDWISIIQQDYEADKRHAAMGIVPCLMANRLSWFFDFKGTSMNLDSACSSSLLALHLACQDLRARTSSMALVGGTNLVYHPNFTKMLSDYGFLSSDGRSWSFDQRANGYGRGDGISVIVIKRLDDALRDGDMIRAVIRNTGSNQDGRTPGITQPSAEAQGNLINQTYKQANIDMGPTRYFEAHGTGTPIGDPTEANAIGRVFKSYRSREDPLHIGSVKANIGHLEGCSGLAGVIKTILILERGVIPPIASLETLNRRIDANGLHLNFPREVIPWPTTGIRRACVNSFGFGGTNATVILDDAYNYLKLHGLHGYHRTHMTTMRNGKVVTNGINHDITLPNPGRAILNDSDKLSEVDTQLSGSVTPKLLVWSAIEQAGAQSLSKAYRHYISQHAHEVDNLAYTLAVRKSHFGWRGFTISEPNDKESIDNNVLATPIKAVSNAQAAFVFTGQGAQYLGMGRQLVAFPVFKKSLELSEDCLKQCACPWSLFDIIDGTNRELNIDTPEYSQPATTCLQLALVDLLKSFGIEPSVVLGHSSGEIAAAYSTGALSRSSAIRIAYYRGKLSSSLSNKVDNLTMMAVGLSKHDAILYLDRLKKLEGTLNIEIGCVNSPKSVTLTGNTEQLTTIERWVKEDSFFARKLRVPIAYHSRFMEQIASDYSAAIGKLEKGQDCEHLPMVSSVTKDIVSADILRTPGYWVRNLTSTVEFHGAFSKVLDRSSKEQLNRSDERVFDDFRVTHVLEIGPHSALQGPLRDILQASTGNQKPNYVPSLIRSNDALISLLKCVGTMYCAGFPVDPLRANGLSDAARPTPPNMPRYPFNHTQPHWMEGRLSKNFRFRESARHDLLGARSLDWNPQIAQWRNHLRLAEVPWLEDHTVGGEIIFPAAGMLVMAVDGFRQLVGASENLRGIQIKNAAFSHPINFPRGTDIVETQLTLSTASQNVDDGSWAQFRLFVVENGKYMECSSGFIRAVVSQQGKDRIVKSVPFMGGNLTSEWVKNILQACQGREQNPYTAPTASTLRYGPAFQNLEHVRLGSGGKVTAYVNTESWKVKGGDQFSTTYVVHPSTLDGLAQLILPALAHERADIPTMVPVRADSVWIDCRAPELQKGRIHVAGICRLSGYRGARADIVATSEGSDHPLVYFEGFETTAISSSGDPDMNEAQPSTLCTRLVWKPDIDTMSSKQMLVHCTQMSSHLNNAAQSYHALVVAIMSYVDEAISYLQQNPPLLLEPHMEAYIAWMKCQHQRLHNGELPITDTAVKEVLNDFKSRTRLISKVEDSGVEGLLTIRVGRNLVDILRGEIDPLDLMSNNGLIEQYYEWLAKENHSRHASAYIDILCFKNPSMKILEVGAGAGAQSAHLLEAMGSDGLKKWTRYDYTDISSTALDTAKTRFQDYADLMDFRKCDISKDPLAQSFEAESYDLVIASHVLHATDDIDKSLRNIRKLLKPNGKLLIFETTRPDAVNVGFAFGLLESWWSPIDFEPRSKHSPCLDSDQWDERLRRAGFSGSEVTVPGNEDSHNLYSSMIISTAIERIPQEIDSSKEIVFVVDDRVQSQMEASRLLEAHAALNSIRCRTCSLKEIAGEDILESSIIVLLLELDGIFLDGISEVDYTNLKSTLVRSKCILWVTRSLSDQTDPRHHLVDGLGRVLMSEDAGRKFATLSLDGSQRNAEQVTKVIFELTKRVWESTVDDCETNYIVKDGTLYVSRIYENGFMNRTVVQSNSPSQSRTCHLNSETQVSLRIRSPGNLNTIEWAESDEINDEVPLEEDEVVVEVRAIGLSSKDYLIASGQLNELDLGTEGAGVIQEAGEKSGFRPGDRVCLISPSSVDSHIRIKSSAVATIPSTVSFREAASMPNALWLAYHTIVNVAKLQEGESVLVYQGTSCFSQLAIQLAKSLGAEVFVTTSSASKGEFLKNEIGVPSEVIFYNDDDPIRNNIHRRTQGQGVDVIIGSLTDGAVSDLYRCLAPCGRIIDINLKPSSVSSVSSVSSRLPSSIPTNVSRTSVNMAELLKKRPYMAHKAFQQAMRMGFEKHLKPPQPLHVFEATDLEAAFRHFQDPQLIGKRIIELNPGSTIVANIRTKSKYSFPPDATYIIAGGLGGLGRSFARWMASRGAKHLALLSRSGAKTDTAKALVSELKMQGVQVVTPKVDISNLDNLKREIQSLTESMPPIRGCIQATLALRDNFFENMSYEDWVVSTRSKVTGSWNLHTALPLNLDFFILLSSLNGIFGSRGQANYGAGNTFKDALAHHRISHGQKAVSFDLGVMVTEGVVAESEYLLASMRRIGLLMDIHHEELIALLDYYCDPNLPVLTHEEAQIIVGIELPSAVIAKGIDLHHSIRRPMFRPLFRMGLDGARTDSSNANDTVNRAELLKNASSEDEAASLVTTWLSSKIAQVLGLAESDVDPGKPVHTYGIDSLAAIDLKNWFEREVGAKIEVFVLLSNISLKELCAEAAKKSRYRKQKST
ncbi:lovastatin nonaketide synthase [Biscogniauxia marginata]|nr:lovastatin nonaketide synthase [Biscogniauxia marginata]